MRTINKSGNFKLQDGTILHYTMNHTGKMAGMISLSTSPFKNQYCSARSKDEKLVCFHCFSLKTQKRFPDLEKTFPPMPIS